MKNTDFRKRVIFFSSILMPIFFGSSLWACFDAGMLLGMGQRPRPGYGPGYRPGHGSGYRPSWRICAGDRVVTPAGNTGRVLGVNVYERTVAVDLDYYSDNNTYDIEAILFTRGCVLGICAGQKAVSPSNNTGVVIGVNPFRQKIAIDLDYYSDNNVYNARDVFAGRGCLPGVCVGDDVVTPSGNTGTVIGVNTSRGLVSVDLDYYSDNNSYHYSRLAVSRACNDYTPEARQRAFELLDQVLRNVH